ncbi:MAG: hypothetical protein ACLSB9_35570 [Hydrogeniiclostridium mannosilyticum]
MGVQRAINGQLITWEVIVYGFLGMGRWRHATKTLGKRRSIAVSTTAPESRWPFLNRMSRYRQSD